MNLDFLIRAFFFLSLIGGALTAHFTGAPMLRGILIGVAVGVAPMLLLAAAALLMTLWSPDHPACRCGRGRSGDYEYVGPERGTAESVHELRCPFCGRRYGSKGGRFWEIATDGSEMPFMVSSRWGRWRADVTNSAVGARSQDWPEPKP